MARTFKERALQALLSGGRLEKTWSKDLPAASVTVGQMNHLFQYAGLPSAGTYPGVAKTATVVTGGDSPSMTSGIITLQAPLSNEQAILSYMDALSVVSTQAGVLLVGDLLAYYPGFDANSALSQATLGTPTTGDTIYTRAYTDYEGVLIFADVTVALGAGAANLSVVYTDQDGLTGTTVSTAMLVSSPQGKIPYVYTGNSPFLRLASGDRGVKSIQSCQLSAGMGVGGTFALCLFKPLLTIPVVQNSSATHNFGMWEGFTNLEAILLGTNPALSMIWVPSATAVGTLTGMVKALNVRSL
jgi:hypothetical protein